MPGKRITDHQVTTYKRFRKQFSQEAAAAKVGISVRSARRLEQCTRLPSQRGMRHWRTRADPLAEVWDCQIKPLLQSAPGLTALSLLEEIQRRYPGAIRFRGIAYFAAASAAVASLGGRRA